MAKIVLPDDNAPMLDWALFYASLGLHVFPCHWMVTLRDGSLQCSCGGSKTCSDKPDGRKQGGKRPHTVNGCKDGTIDTDTIREWWSKWPSANIGCWVGASNLYVVDDDCDKNSSDAIARLEADGKIFPSTLTQKTGSGGRHLIYRAPDSIAPDENGSANVLKKAGYAGIDTRYGNGYILLTPSNHASGGKYSWEDFGKCAKAPKWFVDLEKECRGKKAVKKDAKDDGLRPNKFRFSVDFPKIVDGEKNTVFTAACGTLLQRGVAIETARNILYGCAAAHVNYAGSGLENIKHDEIDTVVDGCYTRYSTDKNTRPDSEFETKFNEGDLVCSSKEALQYWCRTFEGFRFDDHDTMVLMNALVKLNAMAVTDEEIDDAVKNHASLRPKIDVSSDRLLIVRKSLDALARRNLNDPMNTIYRSPDQAWVTVKRHGLNIGIEALDKSALTTRLIQCANYYRMAKENGISGADIPTQVLDSMLSAPGHNPDVRDGKYNDLFPVIAGMAQLPLLQPDRSIYCNSQPHYDAATQRIVRLSPEVADRAKEAVEKASKDRALEAERKLRGIFGDIPFESENEWRKALALIITPFIRESFGERWPWGIIQASQKGEGKTTCANTIAAFSGNSAFMALDSDEEMKKVVNSHLKRGVNTLVLDNLTGVVRSEFIAMLLTNNIVDLREIYAKETTRLRNDLLVIGTANNPTIDQDLVTRAISVNLNSKTAKPAERVATLKVLASQYVQNNIVKCMGWVLDIIAWGAKSPHVALKNHETRFHCWEDVIRGILASIDLEVTFKDAKLEESDPHTEAWQSFVQDWWDMYAQQKLRVASLVGVAFRKDGSNLTQFLDTFQSRLVGSDDPGLLTPLGKMLSKHRGRVFKLFTDCGDLEVEVVKKMVGGTTFYLLEPTEGGG